MVKVAEDSIVLEVAASAPSSSEDGNGSSEFDGASIAVEAAVERPAEPALPAAEEAPAIEQESVSEPGRERGRVKWFDAEKGYGFLVRPTGEDLFVHHSEVEGDASDLGPGGEVEYVVGRNDRGPNARTVRLVQ
ncbi:MAG: hypothetical protein CYG60_06845 [Actinobacteria bacterium]|nr:MAG: hypothetical protein CYG60_06845 [Actinomycetota bacterium]